MAGDEWYKDVVFINNLAAQLCRWNGDGIWSDLYGVYEKLNYVKSLGRGWHLVLSAVRLA